MFKNIFKNKQADLNAELAGQMLQNVFDVCDVKPNTIPLEELQSYSNYRKDRFFIRKIILVVIFIIFLALPLMFIGPKIEKIELVGNGANTTYDVTVSSLLPVTSVHATIDGLEVPLFEKSSNVYSIEPDTDGTMTVTVKCLNGQWITDQIEVDIVDRAVPVITGTETKDGYVYVYLKDDDSGVAWKKIYALDSKNKNIKVNKYDADKGWVRFKNPKSDLTVFVSDNSDNMLQLTIKLSSDKAADKTSDTPSDTATDKTDD